MANRVPLKYDFKTKFYKDIMPKVYGIGAAVVIAGAMFKLLNWPGGALMLGLGLTTEAIIFFLSSFEPKEKELDWTKVYPELLGAHEGSAALTSAKSHGPIGEKIDDMFAKAQIDSVLIERLGQGMHHLANTATNLATMSDFSEVAKKYTVNIARASGVLENMYTTHESALDAMHRLGSASQGTQDYHEQIQNITETLVALNTAYKQELQEADLRSKITHNVYTRIVDSMEKLQAASEETKKFETELAQLSGKIASLNGIYGNMLTALKN
jgi:gliding motility-associated protein GldL